MIFLSVLLKLLDDIICLRFILAKAFKFLDTFRLHSLGFLLHLRELLLLLFQFFPCLKYLAGFVLHLGGKILEIAETTHGLPEVIAGQHIHIPYSRITVLVCAQDKFGIMLRKGLDPFIDLIDFKLSKINLIVIFPYLAIALGDKLLPVCNLLPDEIKIGKLGVAL